MGSDLNYRWDDPGLGDFGHMGPDRVRDLLLKAARLTHSAGMGHPMWLFASEVFRVGPKVGMNLCVHAGVDPDICVRAFPSSTRETQRP
ncbi:MAG: hypothetical protein K0Q76_3487 [Panacagrimonas sp.]|nr:hypothetical protein [Panacagrimonas sp.]MCC2658379.1 hypothetical protein [Panacagrimonas sp.]